MKDLTLYDGDDEIALPWKWEICSHCDGHNVSTAHVECDGGGITGDEMAEIEHDDPGFKRRYMRGDYDRPCPYCEGGKVKVVDRSKVSPDLLIKWDEQCEEDRACDSIERMERMMGV